MQSLRERIAVEARRLGFALCGFARVVPLPHAEFVERWVRDGNAAGMGYIERGLARRFDPRRLVPAVRSIVTVGQRYLPPPLPPVDWRGELRGRIAAYALGIDYHVRVKKNLRRLADFVEALGPGVIARHCVDTGAVLEREWAALAGVGWFGKNTNILHTEQGSWFFLAELLTNLELEPDPPVADHCGTCTRCLDLCPTGALAPGYVLDARRCISYWTIEHRGAIPLSMRAQLGNWIFGCDVCQEVCPWNDKLERQRGAVEVAALLPYLPDLLGLDDAAFRSRFAHTAIRRAKRDSFVRNVAVALGNTRNPAAVPILTAALRGDASALVRAHAAWALGSIGESTARAELDRARRADPDAGVRGEIEAALAM